MRQRKRFGIERLVSGAKPLFLVSAWIFMPAAGFIYIILPMRIIRRMLGIGDVSFDGLIPSALFACSIMGIVSILLYRYCCLSTASPTVADRPPAKQKKWSGAMRFAQGVFCVWLLSYSLWGIFNTPLSQDEGGCYLALRAGDYSSTLSPLKTESHTIATLVTLGTSHLLGSNKFGIRIGATLFTALVLLVIIAMGQKHFSPFSIVLLLSALCLNEWFLWYSHSMRGYMSAVCISLLALYSILEAIHPNPNVKNVLWLFHISIGTALLTHTFAGFFCALLFLSVLVWYLLNWKTLDIKRRSLSQHLIAGGVTWLALYGVIMLFRLGHLKATGYVNYASPDTVGIVALDGLRALLGIYRGWMTKFLVLMLIGFGYYRFHKKQGTEVSLLTIFLAFSLVFYVSVAFAIPSFAMPTRMWLPFLPPLILWLSESSVQVETQPLKGALVAGLFLVLFAPRIQEPQHPIALETPISFYSELESFSFVASEKIQLQRSCLSVTGDPFSERLFREVYFSNYFKQKTPDVCKETYHLHFGVDRAGKKFPLSIPKDKNLNLVSFDTHGRSLHRIY